MDTNQRIKELADMFQLTKAKSGTWAFDLPPVRTCGPLPYELSDVGVYETDSEGRVTYREKIEHLTLPADKRGAVTALCEWYALHAVDSNYELLLRRQRDARRHQGKHDRMALRDVDHFRVDAHAPACYTRSATGNQREEERSNTNVHEYQ